MPNSQFEYQRSNTFEQRFLEARTLNEIQRIIIEDLPMEIADVAVQERLRSIVSQRCLDLVAVQQRNMATVVEDYKKRINFSGGVMKIIPVELILQEQRSQLQETFECVQSINYQLEKHFIIVEQEEAVGQRMSPEKTEDEVFAEIETILQKKEQRKQHLKEIAKRGVKATWQELSAILSSEEVDGGEKQECIHAVVVEFTNLAEIVTRALEVQQTVSRDALDGVELQIENLSTIMSRIADHEQFRYDPEFQRTMESLRDSLCDSFWNRYNALRGKVVSGAGNDPATSTL